MEAIKTEYKTVTDPSQSLIRDIIPGFVSIDCPSEKTIDTIASALRTRYNEDTIMTINMSERSYEYDKMPGHVISVSFRGLPAPPLDILCRLCLQIHQWKTRSENHVVVVHCFAGYSRSAVLLSCYQAWSGKCHHPVDALIDICRGLKIDENESILPSQKRYLNYFFDLLTNNTGIPENQKCCLRVKKLVLSGTPNIPMSEDAKFRPFYEIWTNAKMVFSSLPKDVPIDTLVDSVVPSYDTLSTADLVAVFDDSLILSENDQPICKGDVLFRVRHLAKSGTRYTCLRFAFNTHYVFDNVLHLSHHEIDGNNFPKCMIEVVFDTTTPNTSSSEELMLFQRSHEVSTRLRQGLSIDNDEEVLAKILGLDKGESDRVIPDHVPVIPIHDNTPGGDDVDDFFAQLEREAKM